MTQVEKTASANWPALIDGVTRALAEAKSIDDVAAVMDRAKALQRMTKGVASAKDAHNRCGEIVVYALHREGEELTRMEKAKGGGTGANQHRAAGAPRVRAAPTLAELGIPKKEAAAAQILAAVPVAQLQEHLAAVKEKGGEITTAGALRFAKQRSPKSTKPKKKKQTNAAPSPPKVSAINPIALCAMELRRIVLDAMERIPREDFATLITELRDELDSLQQMANGRPNNGHHATR